MAFKYETQYNSPNYTPESQVYATWGRRRTVEAIAIHWWGDPNQGPTYEGVISYLCRPNGGSSAHFVATGTGRRVACIVDLNNASWATNSANPYTISIECDPRCRDEDYDVVAELIAQIRQVYGNIPLVPHRQFIATACPGNYDLGRLNAIAANKVARPEDDWGIVSNKNVAPPTPPAPAIVEKAREVYNPLKKFKFNKDSLLEYIPNGGDANKGVVYKAGQEIELAQKLTMTDDSIWYRTKYSSDKEQAAGFRKSNLDEVKAPEPKPTPTPTPQPAPSEVKLDQASTTLLQDVKKLLQQLIDTLNSIFKKG